MKMHVHVVLLLFLLAGGARAQAPCPVATETDREARASYEEAIVQEATGNLGAARKMYEQIAAEFSESQFACWAKERLNLLSSGRGYVNKEGRAQFIIGTTSFGAWAGFAIANIAALGDKEMSFDETKAILWGSIGGAVAGLVPSIIFSSDLPMSTGRATMINFGWTWGAWHGLAFSLIPEGDLNAQSMMGLALGISAVGYAGTFALTHYVDVADGDAALISSAASWATWITAAVGSLISEADFWSDEQVWIPILLAGGDAGLTAAALLTGKVNMSAGRVGLISLGGGLGAAVGAGIALAAEVENARAAVALPLGFSVAGLVAAALLTSGYDKPAPAGNGLALLEYTPEGWTLGTPAPRLLALRENGQTNLRLDFPLLGGVF